MPNAYTRYLGRGARQLQRSYWRRLQPAIHRRSRWSDGRRLRARTLPRYRSRKRIRAREKRSLHHAIDKRVHRVKYIENGVLLTALGLGTAALVPSLVYPGVLVPPGTDFGERLGDAIRITSFHFRGYWGMTVSPTAIQTPTICRMVCVYVKDAAASVILSDVYDMGVGEGYMDQSWAWPPRAKQSRKNLQIVARKSFVSTKVRDSTYGVVANQHTDPVGGADVKLYPLEWRFPVKKGLSNYVLDGTGVESGTYRFFVFTQSLVASTSNDPDIQGTMRMFYRDTA